MTRGLARLFCGVALWVFCAVTAVRAETASEAFARGQKLLAEGNLDEATRALAAAASGERQNSRYVQQYTLVRQVGMIRQRLETEQDPQRWRYLASALRAFYIQQELLPLAIELDRRVHEKLHDAASALNLAETALAMNLDAEAAETLQSLGAPQRTLAADALLGVALARQGRLDEAKSLAGKVEVPEDAVPIAVFSAARLQAAVGNTESAMALLTRSLESVPSSRQEAFRSAARRCPEFRLLADTPGFATALAAKSKVPESACSGGSSCAGCPMRGQCPSSQKQ